MAAFSDCTQIWLPIGGEYCEAAPIINLKDSSLAIFRYGCIAWLLAAPASMLAGIDIFMRIGGQAAAMGSQQTAPTLASESTDAQYPNWIPVLSMSHGVSNPGGTRPDHSGVNYMKKMDQTTPSMNLLINSTNVTATVTQPIDYVTLDFRQSGTTNVFYRMELQGVVLEAVQISASTGGDDRPLESVSFKYEKIRWSYVPNGSGKATTTGWDVVAGKAY